MSRRAWSSGLRETWRSILLWMHWRRRAKERQRLEWLRLQKLQEEWLMQCLRSLLLEALEPIALAMQRQDRLMLDQVEDLRNKVDFRHDQQMELLGEILNSLQPSVRQQLGLPSRPLSSLNSGT